MICHEKAGSLVIALRHNRCWRVSVVIRSQEVSGESKIREVFQKEYPDFAIDHLSADGNMTWGLYYNVWYKKAGDAEARLGICTTHPETKEWGCKAPLFESSK